MDTKLSARRITYHGQQSLSLLGPFANSITIQALDSISRPGKASVCVCVCVCVCVFSCVVLSIMRANNASKKSPAALGKRNKFPLGTTAATKAFANLKPQVFDATWFCLDLLE